MALVKGTNCGFVTSAPSADPEGLNQNWDNAAVAGKFVAPVGATSVTEMGWYCDAATEAADYELGVYAHDAGDDKPAGKIGGSAALAKGTTSGWKVATGLSIAITAGTTYWLAMQCDNTATGSPGNYAETAGERRALELSETTLADPFSTTPTLSADRLCGIYAVYETGGEEGTNMQLQIGDAWKTIDGMQINIGDSWLPAVSASINIGDAWKTIF